MSESRTVKKSVVKGSCHCGGVTCQLSASPGFSFLCHCDGCRKLNGGMRLAGASYPLDAFTVEGPTTRYTYQGGKGEIEVHFCPVCGTSVYAYPKALPGSVVVRGGVLEDGVFSPDQSIFEGQACAWDSVFGGSAIVEGD